MSSWATWIASQPPPNPRKHLPLLWKPYTAASLLRTVAAALQDGPARDEGGGR